jgi:acetylornithine deacetylase/succinyl-diaminopimelate desuccinylase-like protein
VTVTPGSTGDAFDLDTTGPAYDAYRQAFAVAWDTETVEIGAGGSIPFVAAFSQMFPDADILLTGAGDPTSAAHGPNESQDLDDLRRSTIAEAIALRLLAESGP